MASTASRSSALRSCRAIPSSEARSKSWSAFTSSITALIAVLKWKSCSMSWVTLWIVP